MADEQHIELVRLADGDTGLRSVLKKADGTPRFVLPLPFNMMADSGIRYMVLYESLQGGFQYQTRRFFDAHLGPDDLFIDVGAHWGIFTLTAASLHPGKLSVIAVEANPFNVTRLQKSVRHNGFTDQVEIIPCALGAETGLARLVGGRGTMGHSVDGVSYRRPDDGLTAPEAAYSVPVLTLDYILARRPELADKTVFLKVDVEGYEIEVLEGAADLIASGRLVAMVVEKGKSFTEEPYLSAFGAMLDRLRGHGFACYRFKGNNEPGPLIPYALTPESCDVVCIGDRITPLARYE